MFLIGIFGIEDRQKEIMKLNNVICPHCGASVAPGFSYCPYCGKEL